MPEESEVETGELHEKIHEAHAEAHEHGDAEHAKWVRWIGLSTAILAVFAAIGSLKSGAYVNEALLSQIQASDQWNYYQAKSIKKTMYTLGANSLLDNNQFPPRVQEYRTKAADESKEADGIKKQAEEFEKDREKLLRRHERFAVAVTLTQIAIACGAIAALSRNRNIWLGGLVAGAIGVGMILMGLSGF